MNKIFITFLFILQSSFAFANSNPLNVEFGSTVDQVKSEYSLRYLTEDKISGGPAYFITQSQIKISKSNGAIIMFNDKDNLAGVGFRFSPFSFKDLFASLSNKYENLNENGKPFGDKLAKFKNGDITIVLEEKLVTGKTFLYYLTKEYTYLLKIHEDKAKKEKYLEEKKNGLDARL